MPSIGGIIDRIRERRRSRAARRRAEPPFDPREPEQGRLPLDDEPEFRIGELHVERGRSIRDRLDTLRARRPLRDRLDTLRRRRRSRAPRATLRRPRPIEAIRGRLPMPRRSGDAGGTPLGSAVRRAGSAIGTAVVAVAAGAVVLGTRLADTWFTLPLLARQRFAAGAGLAAGVALLWFVVVPLAPCWVPAGDRCPPGDDTLAVVPADAVAYIHLNVDPDTDQYEAAQRIAERLPLLTGDAVGALSSTAGTPINFERDLRPFSAGEVALAVLPAGATLERVLIVETADAAAAEKFAAGLGSGKTTKRDIRDVTVSVDSNGLATAVVDGFLVIGSEGPVGKVIEAANGDSLAADDAATQVLDDLPDNHLLDVYMSADGARTLLGGGALGPLNTFVDARAGSAVGAALSVTDDSLTLSIRSVLDPERAKATPSFFAALPSFDPSLPGAVGKDALAYFGLGDPAKSVASLLDQAASDAPGLTAGFDRFSERLRKQSGVSFQRQILPLLGSEVAISVEPVAAPTDSGLTPGVIPPTRTPYLSVVADHVDAKAAEQALARLQGPIAAALDPGEGGQAPVFENGKIGDVTVNSLRLSRVVDLTYATFGDRLVVATNPDGIRRAADGGDGLDHNDAFKRAIDGFGGSSSILVYLDLRNLLTLAERIGLGDDPAYAQVAGDLRTLDAAALSVRSSPDALDTDLRILIGEREEPNLQPSPVAGE